MNFQELQFYDRQKEQAEQKLRSILAEEPRARMKALIRFHSENKYLYFCYDVLQKDRLGQILANHEKKSADAVASEYESTMRQLFSKPPSEKNTVNALLHIFGYFKNDLNQEQKKIFLQEMEDYRKNKIDGTVLRDRLRTYAQHYEKTYLLSQTILEPFLPKRAESLVQE